MSEFNGEQKLRVVLESILRNVPKSEQCKKYGITEAEFDSWNDKLIREGSTIYDDPKPSSSVYRTPWMAAVRYLGKFGLWLSILVNLAGICVLGVWYFSEKKEQVIEPVPVVEEFVQEDSPFYGQSENAVLQQRESPLMDESSPDDDIEDYIAGFDQPDQEKNFPLESLLADPLRLPTPEVLSPVNPEDLNAEVTLFNKTYKGKHVVYALDASVYMVENNRSVQRFEKMRNELMDSIINLSSNSYFNLILYWNLREAAALKRTIIRANQENKKLALDWLSGLGGTPKELKVNRNRFFQKELLFANPLPGIIGPWYGVSTAVSYDPDIIFVFSGNTPVFSPTEVPKSHFSRLGVTPDSSSAVLETNSSRPISVSDLIRLTAFKWLSSMKPSSQLPSSPSDVEEIALKRLGLWGNSTTTPFGMNLPWKKVFEYFLTGLEVNYTQVPRSHFFVYLPEHTVWPRDLAQTVHDFALSSKGTFVLNPDQP